MERLKLRLKNFDKNYLYIFIVAVFLMIFLGGKIIAGHDTRYHVANILNLGEGANLGDLFTQKIFPNAANNFGYGAGLFYPQFSHIVVAIFYSIFGISVTKAIMIADFLAILLSGIFMYSLLKIALPRKESFRSVIPLIGTLFYMTMPYKIDEVIVRGAMAENWIFVFLPMVLLGIHYLFRKQYWQFFVYFVIGYVGMINSHLVLTIYVTIFIALILLTQWKKLWRKEVMGSFVMATITVILICLPFIVPMFQHMVDGNYVVFSENGMTSLHSILESRLVFNKLFLNEASGGGIYFFVNIVALLLIIFVIAKLVKQKEFLKTIRNDYLFATGTICFLLGMFMSSKLFPWNLMPDFLLMIQFPWRLEVLMTVGVGILCCYALMEIGKYQYTAIVISVTSCILVAFYCISAAKIENLDIKKISLSTTGLGAQREYLPVNAKKSYDDWSKNRSSDVEIVAGNAEVKTIVNNTPYLEFEVTNVDDEVKLELPRLYYLGYTIKNESGEKIPYYENERGFIEMEIDKDATIEVNYDGTTETRVANIVSIVTLIGFSGSIGWFVIGEKMKAKK